MPIFKNSKINECICIAKIMSLHAMSQTLKCQILLTDLYELLASHLNQPTHFTHHLLSLSKVMQNGTELVQKVNQ